MFGFVGDLVGESVNLVRSSARTIASPVTDVVEEVTGISSKKQKDVLEELAIGPLARLLPDSKD